MAGLSEEQKLKKVMGLTDVLSVAFGQTVGAGIIVLTGVAIGMTGAGVTLAYILAALITLIAFFPVAALGTAFPGTGGQYQYTSRLWSPKIGFLYLLCITPTKMAIALYALTFAQYLSSLLPGIPIKAVAILLLVFMYVSNLIGLKVATNILKFILINLLLALGLFVVYGVPEINYSVFSIGNMAPHGMSEFFAAVALLTFATGGSVVVSELGGEMKNPKRDIPIAVIGVPLFIGFMYAVIAAVASGVLPIEKVAGKNLSEVANVILPHPIFIYFIVCGTLMSSAKMMLLTFAWASKPLLMGCIHGWLPKSFGVVNERFGTPHMVLSFLFVVGLIPLVTGMELQNMAKMVGAVAAMAVVFPISSAYFLPDKYPELCSNIPLNLSPTVLKVVTVLGSVLMLGQAYMLIVKLPQNLIIGAAIYLAIAIAVVWISPNREIEFSGNPKPKEDTKTVPTTQC